MWIVRLQKGSSSVECPRCGSINSIDTINGNDVFNSSDNSSHDSKVEEITYTTELKCKCHKCSNEFTVEFGKSKYSTYSISEDDDEDNLLLAKFDSDFQCSYAIYRSKIPCSSSKYVFYIMSDRSDLPIFIGCRQAKKLLKNHEETLKFIGTTVSNK